MEKLRMCISCRSMKDKRDLIRIVKDNEGNISLDYTGKKNGRGAYVCRDENCLNKLQKNKALNKAFKTNVSDDIYNSIVEDILGNK